MGKQRNHLVPKFLLRNFSKDGKFIYLHNKYNGKTRRTNISNSAVNKGFYIDKVEDTLSTLESEVSLIVDNKILKGKSLLKKEVESLHKYVIIQYIRTKQMYDLLHSELEKQGINFDLYKAFNEMLYNNSNKTSSSLSELFNKKTLYIHSIPRRYINNEHFDRFIVSDNPCIVGNFSPPNQNNFKFQIILVISPNHALHFSEKKLCFMGYLPLTDTDTINMINYYTFENATQIISKKEIPKKFLINKFGWKYTEPRNFN